MGYIMNLESIARARGLLDDESAEKQSKNLEEVTKQEPGKRIKEKPEVPICEKANLTLAEAAAYSGVGINKLREITNEKNCQFVLFVGRKRLIKRRLFDKYIEERTVI